MYPNVNEEQCYENVITITPTLTVHANYAAADYVGTSGVATEIAGAARVPGGRGVITQVALIDGVKASVAGELWVFTTAVTPPNDSAAWAVSDADLLTCVGVFPFSTYYAATANSIAFYDSWHKGFKCPAGTTSLYACFVTRGAPAYAATGDLAFVITILQD